MLLMLDGLELMKCKSLMSKTRGRWKVQADLLLPQASVLGARERVRDFSRQKQQHHFSHRQHSQPIRVFIHHNAIKLAGRLTATAGRLYHRSRVQRLFYSAAGQDAAPCREPRLYHPKRDLHLAFRLLFAPMCDRIPLYQMARHRLLGKYIALMFRFSLHSSLSSQTSCWSGQAEAKGPRPGRCSNRRRNLNWPSEILKSRHDGTSIRQR